MSVEISSTPHDTAHVSVQSAGAIEPGLVAAAESFGRAGRYRAAINLATTPTIRKRVAAGEVYDLLIVPADTLDDLATDGKLMAQERVQLGRVGVGVAVRTGAPVPAIGDAAALERSLSTAVNAYVAAVIVTVITGGLAIDQFHGAWGQPAVAVVAWLIFCALLARSPGADRIDLIACLVFATMGEIFLALVWGLYDYRLGNLPLFVPPGHVLLYALGCSIAGRLPLRAAHVIGVLAAGMALLLAVAGRDTLSLPLTVMFLVALRFGPAPRLYATMFVLALAMELYGTWLGNWVWRMEVPWFGWTTLNPPFAAGAFYCMLDWLVGLARKARTAGLGRMPA